MKKKLRYSVLDHTADIGISISGGTREELFQDAAWGMTDLITNAEEIKPSATWFLSLQADSQEELLVRWLSELLYLYEVERKCFSACKFSRLSRTALEAEIQGEAFEPQRHEARREIKAVTYHGLRVYQKDGFWKAEVIFDI